jgi:hypothetical protein
MYWFCALDYHKDEYVDVLAFASRLIPFLELSLSITTTIIIINYQYPYQYHDMHKKHQMGKLFPYNIVYPKTKGFLTQVPLFKTNIPNLPLFQKKFSIYHLLTGISSL